MDWSPLTLALSPFGGEGAESSLSLGEGEGQGEGG
jgi:hypothetical protein